MRIAFLGFGLIAGSIARAVRSNPLTSDWAIVAWSPSGDGPRQALADGVVDVAAAAPEAALSGADVVVLAAPATACLTLIDRLGGPWRTLLAHDGVVTDVASTKGSVVRMSCPWTQPRTIGRSPGSATFRSSSRPPSSSPWPGGRPTIGRRLPPSPRAGGAMRPASPEAIRRWAPPSS